MENFESIKAKYSYRLIKNGDQYYWRITETATDYVIEDHIFEEDAVERISFLEKGGAFGGFTPEFVLRKYNIEDLVK